MAAAARVGDSTTPHEDWSGGTISEGSANVVVEGAALSGVGDAGTPHSHLPSLLPPHPTLVSGGSGTVLVNGKPVARVGDPMVCGSVISSGSGTVIVGG